MGAAPLAGQPYWVAVENVGVPFPIVVRLGKSPDGRLACTGMVIGPDAELGQEITARSLRQIPLGQILSTVAGLDFPGAEELGGEVTHLWRQPPARPGPTALSREDLQRVAEDYRAALLQAPRSPIKLMAQKVHASEATIRRRVQRARDMGLLRPVQPGKAGEKPLRRTRKEARS
jgi:hypothetical protein